MDQDQPNEAIAKFQYSGIKPSVQLVKYLRQLEEDRYQELFDQIEEYDELKIKRIVRHLKPSKKVNYFRFLLKHKIKIQGAIPEEVVDVKELYTLDQSDKIASEKVNKQLMEKLQGEFLVDSKNKDYKNIQFKGNFYGLLKDEDISIIIGLCLKLAKRSEQNLDTLHIVLEELQNTKYEISTQMQEIQDTLSEHMNNEIAINNLKLALNLVKQEKIQKSVIQFIGTLINSTHDEKKKQQYFTVLTPITGLAKQLADIVLQIAPYLNSDVQVFELAHFFTSLNYELYNYPQLKKLINLNKHTNAFVSLIVAQQLLDKKSEVCNKEFHELIDLIHQSLASNFKNFAKVVTQPIMFLSELKCILLYMLFCEDQAPSKLFIAIAESINRNTSIFDSKSHLTQLKYLIAPSCPQESQLFLDTFILHLCSIYDPEDQFSFQQLQPIFTLVCFSSKDKNSVIFNTKLMQLFEDKDDHLKLDTFQNNFFKTLYNYLYQINPNQGEGINFCSDRLNHLLSLLLNSIQDLEEPQYLYMSLCHSLLSRKLIKKVKVTEFPFQPIHLISKYGIQSHNPDTVESTLNFIRFVVDNRGTQELMNCYLPCIDPNNLENIKSLNELEEQLKKLPQINWQSDLLHNQGLLTLVDDRPIDKMELQLKQEFEKSQTHKALMMDEGEAKLEMLKKQRIKLSQYYGLCLRILEPIIKSQAQEQFFTAYFDQISQFAIEINCKHVNFNFIMKYLDSYQITQQFKRPLASFFQYRANNLMPNDEIVRKINQFQEVLLKSQIKQQSLLYVIHLFNIYIIQQKSFDLSTKTMTFAIILQYAATNEYYKTLIEGYYVPFVKNINICAHAKNASAFLNLIFDKSPVHYAMLFTDILNYVAEAQLLILKTIDQIPDDFDLHLKIRILEEFEETKEQVKGFIDPKFKQLDKLQLWNMQDFIQRSAKEHIESMINIMAQFHVDDIFCDLMQKAAQKLYTVLEDEQLEFFPYFVEKFKDRIPVALLGPIMDLLIKYCDNEERQILISQCIQAGNSVIHCFAKSNAKEILNVLEKNLKQNSVIAVVFLGVLSPYLQGSNQFRIQEQILILFRTQSKATVVSLSKYLKDLLGFFPETENLIVQLLQQNKVEKDPQIKMAHSFLIAGLVKGIGIESLEQLKIIDFFENREVVRREPIEDKQTLLFQLEALIQVFGKVIEPYIVRLMKLLMKYFGDNKQEIRELAINSARLLMQNLTGYGVKIMLQPLLKGLDEDTQWRGKVANIWALGNMAYCSPKQLSQCLPQIVNSISKAISDTHPDVKQSANDSLKLIGSTIKNPEISSIADLLIIALSNPYDENLKGLQVVLETKFRHYIDAPAMSLLIPIIDYGLKAQDSEQRRKASILVGGLPILIQTADDLVPYMDLITGGLEIVLGDAMMEVRSVAAKAIGQISKKIGVNNSKQYFKFVWDILESKEWSANKRSGAAHALAEISCVHGEDFLSEQFQYFFEQIKRPETHVKEGYIGLFVYMPSILQRRFDNYVKDVIDNIYECVSHDEDIVSSITLRVLKIVIKNFGVIQNELLYPVLTEALLHEESKKRNAGLLLSGEMLKLAIRFVKQQLEKPAEKQLINIEMYFQNLMSMYIVQADVTDIIRQNAVAIWKDFIDNTPKTLKRAIRQYIRQLCVIAIKKGTYQMASNSIRNFSEKYGESQLGEGFKHIGLLLEEESNLDLVKGAYQVLNLIYQFTHTEILIKYKDDFIEFSRIHILGEDHLVKQQLFLSIQTMITKVKSTQFVEQLVEPYLEELAEMDENDTNYGSYLDIFNQLCQLNHPLILHYLINLILVPPLYQYKIDILTTNAAAFASVIYKKYEKQVPMQILMNDMYACAEIDAKVEFLPRPQSLLYCIGSLASNIQSDVDDSLTLFVDDVLKQLTEKSKPILGMDEDSQDKLKYCLVPLQLLEYFIANTSEEHEQYAQNIIEKVVPFLFLHNIFLSNKQHELLYTLSNKIIFTINNTLDRQYHIENMKYIHTCFTNRPNVRIPGLNIEEGTEPYVSMLIDTFVYCNGRDEFFNYGIDFIKLLIKETETQNLQQNILKLVGALIRVLNCKININCKVSALEVIEQAMLKLNIEQFRPQLVITYDKIAVDINQGNNGLKQLSKNYSLLFHIHERKDYLLNILFNKAIGSETLEMRECYLKIVKKALKDQTLKAQQIFSSAVLERFFVLGKQFFDKCLNVQRFETVCANEVNQMAQILAIAYKYTNKNNKDNYLQKYLTLDPYNLLLKLQFSRYHEITDATEIICSTIQQINNQEDEGYVLVLIKLCRKIKILHGLRQKLQPRMTENASILIAMSIL